MPIPSITREAAEDLISAVEDIMGEGFQYPGLSGDPANPGAVYIYAKRESVSAMTIRSRLKRAKELYGVEPRQEAYRPARAAPIFEIEGLPTDGEPSAEELIILLKERHAKRRLHEAAAELRQVKVTMDGPVAIAFIGDPHIDDPGCAWGDLERDVAVCRDTPGVMAVNVGDTSNNWVGRLMRLYANQSVTARQSLKLIEWLMLQLPWLLWEPGNHGAWHTDYGDPAEIMHRLHKSIGVYSDGGARMQLNLPNGAAVRVNVRHDFPGRSQFNPAHALVRETLFGYRDHILACGHRHQSGYVPIWHNDPKRLCHGLRAGAYKDWDHYAKEKGFKEENWARAMGAVINPDYSEDPVRFIKPFFNLEEMAEYLTWRRGKWEVGKSAT
jgi:hypothetical protein